MTEFLLKLTEQAFAFAKDVKNVERPNIYYQNCVFERPYPILLNANQPDHLVQPETGQKVVKLEIEELEKYINEKSGADPKQVSYFIGYVKEFLEGQQ